VRVYDCVRACMRACVRARARASVFAASSLSAHLLYKTPGCTLDGKCCTKCKTLFYPMPGSGPDTYIVLLPAGASPSPLTGGLIRVVHSLLGAQPAEEGEPSQKSTEKLLLNRRSPKESPWTSPLKSECAKTFPAMVISVVKKSRDAGTKSVNLVHLVQRAYEVWPRELKKAFAEQAAGAAFLFQAIPMHTLHVRLFFLLPHCVMETPLVGILYIRIVPHTHP
jgi:hypothetical protein